MAHIRRVLLQHVAVALSLGFVAPVGFSTARAYPRKVPFQDADGFDNALGKSMEEGFEAIDVELPQSAAQRMPARLRAWIARVQSSGGEVRFRDVTPKSRGIWMLLAEFIAGIIGPYAVDALRTALHDPASDYHAVLVGQGTSPETAMILGVEFYRRGSSSWAEALDNSKPMKLKG